MSKRVYDMLSMAGKVTVVTGAASGIGYVTAELFAEMGAAVALIDVEEERGVHAAKKIRATGGKAAFFQCNVTSNVDCKKTVKAIQREFVRIDVLFNNAGVIRRKDVVQLEEEEWDMVVDVSLKGVYLLSHHVIPVMIANGGGSIINTGSGWGHKGGPAAAAYCAAKGGVVNLTRAMAIDHGREGIRVNCVSPGDIDTPLLRDEARQLGVDEREFMKEAADRPLNRVGTPQDVANVVLFLAGDLSRWVTGTSIIVDGGGLA